MEVKFFPLRHLRGVGKLVNPRNLGFRDRLFESGRPDCCVSRLNGAIAQLVEHCPEEAGVAGSNPAGTTSMLKNKSSNWYIS